MADIYCIIPQFLAYNELKSTNALLCLSYTSNYVQFFNLMGAILFFFSLKWDLNFIFGFLCLIKPDSDRNTIL